MDAWTLERIRDHIATSLPLMGLFNMDVADAGAESGRVRLGIGENITRLGGGVSGPVHFALADAAMYALSGAEGG